MFILNVFLYCLISYIFYVNESTGSWHGELRRYKHKNLLVIFLFTCKVASGSPAVTPQTSLIFSFAQSVK